MKASYLPFGLLMMAAVAGGCDNISEDDRYIKVEKPLVDSRNLLIMEFTGNSCVNCPNGAREITLIKDDEAPGRVISVGLHPYGDINTEPVPCVTPPYKQDLRSEAATALYAYYAPSGFPTAIFNGTKSSMSSAIPDWMQRASQALLAPAYMNINATTTYNEETRLAEVNYEVNFSDIVKGDLNATVWLVENGISGTQKQPDGKNDYYYIHNHVLRASLNGDWGEGIGDSFKEGDRISRSASMTLDATWVAENCDIVVYVYRDSDKEVEQAISLPLIPSETDEP